MADYDDLEPLIAGLGIVLCGQYCRPERQENGHAATVLFPDPPAKETDTFHAKIIAGAAHR